MGIYQAKLQFVFLLNVDDPCIAYSHVETCVQGLRFPTRNTTIVI